MVKSGDDKKRKSGDFYRDPRVKPEDDTEWSSRGMTQGLGILEFLVYYALYKKL